MFDQKIRKHSSKSKKLNKSRKIIVTNPLLVHFRSKNPVAIRKSMLDGQKISASTWTLQQQTQTSVAHAQEEVHSGVVVFVCIFASPSAVPWCARDGLRWTFPLGGSIVRGTRPQSEKWPHAKHVESGSAQSGPADRWRSSHVRHGVPTTRAPDPDVAQEAANQRVIKLEAALRAMGDYDGPEVATWKSSLLKARVLHGANRFRIKLRTPRHSSLVPRNVCQL